MAVLTVNMAVKRQYNFVLYISNKKEVSFKKLVCHMSGEVFERRLVHNVAVAITTLYHC